MSDEIRPSVVLWKMFMAVEQQCMALADTVADEGHALYQAFTPESLRELLVKIRESALAGMEKGRDAWGYTKP